MKRKTRAALCIIAVSVAFVSLISCRKEVPEGQLISADGIVTDVSTGDPFPGKPVSLLYRPYSNATSDTLIGGLNYHRELTDTLQLNGSGDVQVDKHIGSTTDFPWHQ